MRLLKIFNTPKHQRFEYRPRHWNANKEELQNRLDLIERVKQNDPDALKERIAQNFRRGGGGGNSSARKKAVLRSNLLLLGIIAGLLILTYLFLIVYLPVIADALGTQPVSE